MVLSHNMVSEICRVIKTYSRNRQGIAAIEFSLIFPIFIALFYVVAEFANYNMIKRRAQQSIDYATEFITRDNDNNLTRGERFDALDIWSIVNPTSHLSFSAAEGRHTNGFARSFAGVEFKRTPDGCDPEDCNFEPEVVWTWSHSNNQGVETPIEIKCSLSVVSNDSKLDGRSIPEGMLGRSAVIISEYTYRYVPIFPNILFQEHDINVSSIRKTRGGNVVGHTHRSATQC